MKRPSVPGLALVLAIAFHAGDVLAATPVSLPPGEPAAEWEQAFALGGLVAGPIGEGAWVQLTDGGDYWLLRVKDAAGKIHEANVLPPASQQDREDTIWLAMSLLKPAAGGATWNDVPKVEPPAPPPPPPPPPVVVSAPTPVPAPTPPPPAVTPPVATPPATTTVDKPPADTDFWLLAGGGIGWRSDAALGADVHAAAGIGLGGNLRVGLGLDVLPAVTITDLGGERRIGSVDVTAGVGYRIGSSVYAVVGASGGISLRSLSQAGELLETTPAPILGADVAVAIPLTGPLSVLPYAEFRYDLRQIKARVGANAELGEVGLSTVAVRGGVALQFSPKND